MASNRGVDIDADDLFVQANDDARVKAAVRKRAASMTSRVRKELARADVKASVSIRDHPLPNGRTSVDVYVEAADDKDARTVGRIVRRAGREGRGR